MNKHYRKVSAALQDGARSYIKIAQVTGLKTHKVTFEIFNHPELMRKYAENGGRV